jgi:hypothetical protein
MVDAAMRDDTRRRRRLRPRTTGQLVAGARLSKTGPDNGFHCARLFYLARCGLGRHQRPTILQTGPNPRLRSAVSRDVAWHPETTGVDIGRKDTRWPSPC